jgi:hypothetical protein
VTCGITPHVIRWDCTVLCPSVPRMCPRRGRARANVADDLYDVPGGNGTIIGMLRQGQVVKVVKACPSGDWCDLTDPKGSAWGSFLKNN